VLLPLIGFIDDWVLSSMTHNWAVISNVAYQYFLLDLAVVSKRLQATDLNKH
jgi:uncharacterized membrane protein YkvA (DUF1232 family)